MDLNKDANPRVVSFMEAFELCEEYFDELNMSYEDVMLVDNLEFDADLDSERLGRYIAENSGDDHDVELLCVLGNLKVNGRIRLCSMPTLVVMGETHAETVEHGAGELLLGEGQIKYFVHGNGSDGDMNLRVKTPFIVAFDQQFFCPEKDAVRIDAYGSEDGWEYHPKNLQEAFVSEVIQPFGDDGRMTINIERFYGRLKAGEKVLK